MYSPPSSPEHNNSSNDDYKIYSDMFSRYEAEEELDTDDLFWEFMDESNYPPEEKQSEEESEGVAENESETEEEENEKEEVDYEYDGDDGDD